MLILASGSPRRREILSMLGYSFTVKIADTDETIPAGTAPGEAVQLLAKRKAAMAKEDSGDHIIIGADTIVVLGGQILGKPKDKADAISMLERLSGKTHEVYTGVSIKGGGKDTAFSCVSKVTFYELTHEEILRYVETGEPMDKAGAYGIQGKGLVNIKNINGDFYSVMGLPGAEVARALREYGVFPENIEY